MWALASTVSATLVSRWLALPKDPETELKLINASRVTDDFTWFRCDTIHGKHDITIEIHSHSLVVEGHKMA